MSLVVEMKPQLWQTPAGQLCYQGCGVALQTHPLCRPLPCPHLPLRVSVWTLRCRSQLALVVKADRQIKHMKGRSPGTQG